MNEKINLQLTIEEINAVISGLAELPAKLSMNLITSIQNQAAAQMQPTVGEAPLED